MTSRYGEIMRARIAVHARVAFNNAAKAWADGEDNIARRYEVEGKEYARCARFWATWGGKDTKLLRMRARIMAQKPRSAWDKGVKEYALDLLDNVDWYELSCQFSEYVTWDRFRRCLLNGAGNWAHYSWGGAALCYNEDICRRLYPKSFQQRKRFGMLPPEGRREWLDVQTAALHNAEYLLKKAFFEVPDNEWGEP